MQGHHQRKYAVPGEGKHKRQAAAQLIRQRRKQAGANKQPHKGGRREGGLVGDTEDTLLAGMENILCQQPGADIAGLKKIVQLEEAAQRQEGDKRPQANGGGERIDASGQAGVGMSWGGERGVAQNLGGRHIIIFLR